MACADLMSDFDASYYSTLGGITELQQLYAAAIIDAVMHSLQNGSINTE